MQLMQGEPAKQLDAYAKETGNARWRRAGQTEQLDAVNEKINVMREMQLDAVGYAVGCKDADVGDDLNGRPWLRRAVS